MDKKIFHFNWVIFRFQVNNRGDRKSRKDRVGLDPFQMAGLSNGGDPNYLLAGMILQVLDHLFMLFFFFQDHLGLDHHSSRAYSSGSTLDVVVLWVDR